MFQFYFHEVRILRKAYNSRTKIPWVFFRLLLHREVAEQRYLLQQLRGNENLINAAVSIKVVPQRTKCARDNAERYFG